MLIVTVALDEKLVALRKESVDRNVSAFDVLAVSAGRSPQGERG